MCEPRLFKHQSPGFVCVTIRPATLCGYAPRQRLDLSVNILTNHAIKNGTITGFGGSQKRPNLHLQDMVDLYKLLLTVPDEKIAGQIFNAGFQNMSIMEIARIVKHVVQEIFPEKGEIPIVTTPTDDIRSYHVNSDKIQRMLGFKPKHTIEDAVRDLCAAVKAGKLPNSMDDNFYFNVRRLKELQAAGSAAARLASSPAGRGSSAATRWTCSSSAGSRSARSTTWPVADGKTSRNTPRIPISCSKNATPAATSPAIRSFA